MTTKFLTRGAWPLVSVLALPAFVAQADDTTETAPAELAPITVQADPFAGRTPLESTQPVEVLANDALERARGQTLGDSLQTLPGVHTADFGAGSSRPVIRGQGGPRVRILDGGAGVVDASTISPDHNAAIEPFRAQQLEVLKGPATLLYGSGAIGGVVNVVSDMFPGDINEGWHGALGTQLQSVNDGRSYYGHAEGRVGGLVLHLDGLTRDTKDYDIPGAAELVDEEHADEEHEHESVRGTVPGTFTETDSFALGASWVGRMGFIGVGVSSYDSVYGVPGHAHGEEEHGHGDHEDDHADERRKSRLRFKDADEHGDEEEESVFIDLTQRRYELRAELTQPIHWLERARGSVVITDYRHDEVELGGHGHGHEDEEHSEEEGGAEIGSTFRNDAREIRLEFTHVPLGGWRGVFGIQGINEDFEAFGEEAFVPPVDTASTGLFLIEERDIGPGRLSLGTRVESVKHTASGTNPSRSFDLFNLSAGWHQDLGDSHHMNLNLSLAERAPDVLELYSDGPHLATRTIEQGNANLRKERSLNIDLGHAGERDNWFYKVDLFYTRYQDYIFAEEHDDHDEHEAHDEGHHDDDHDERFARKSGDDDHDHDHDHDEHGHDDGGLTPVDYVQTDADFYGGELAVGYRLNARHTLRLFADTVRAERDNGARLPRIPADRIGLAFDGGWGNWAYGLRYIQVLEQKRVTEFEGRTDGYGLLNADISYLLPLGGQEISIALRGRNLLDEEVRNHVSFLKNLAPQPGVNAILDVEWRF